MSANVRELLFEYALGALPVEDAASVEAAIAADATLMVELQSIEEDVASMMSELQVSPPRPDFKTRLLSAIAHHGRLERFAEQMADIIDASVERARHLLRLVDDEAAWIPLFPGCDGLHIRPGPRVAGQDVGLIRMAPGSAFPTHKHLGDELVLVLQGSLQDDDGTAFGPGDVVRKSEGTSHAFRVTSDDGLVYLVVVGGVEIPGVVLEEPPPEMLH